MSNDQLKMVPLSAVSVSDIALRGVNVEGIEYQLLRDSIARTGKVLESVLMKETEEEGKYILCNGLQRYTASVELGFKEIPALITEMDDKEFAISQIITNSRRVKTKPIEYTKHIIHIFSEDPTMTFTDMCHLLSCEPEWLNGRLSLLKLKDEIKPLVDNSDIGLSNAFLLAKLPQDEQDNWVGAAQNEPASEFVPKVRERLNEIQKEKRGLKVDAFVAEPKMRKAAEIKDLYADLSAVKAIVKGIKDPVAAAQYMVKWIVQMDDVTIAEKEAEHAKLREEKAERKAIADKKREEAKRAKVLAEAGKDAK